jgi:hypothetical protein
MSKLFSNNKSSWYAALKNLFYLYKTFFLMVKICLDY